MSGTVGDSRTRNARAILGVKTGDGSAKGSSSEREEVEGEERKRKEGLPKPPPCFRNQGELHTHTRGDTQGKVHAHRYTETHEQQARSPDQFDKKGRSSVKCCPSVRQGDGGYSERFHQCPLFQNDITKLCSGAIISLHSSQYAQ